MHNDHATIEQLSALLDDQLAEPEASAVRVHLVSCESCRAELEQLRGTVLLLHAVPAAALPRSFRVPQQMEERSAPLLRLPAWLLPSPVALRALAGVAAALMVVLFVADVFQPVASQGRGVAALAPAASEISADQAAARQEPRALAPQARTDAAEGAPALRSAPVRSAGNEQPFAQPPGDASAGRVQPAAQVQPPGQPVPQDASGVSAPSASRIQPAGSPAPAGPAWVTPGRLAALVLVALAMALLVASFLVRRWP